MFFGVSVVPVFLDRTGQLVEGAELGAQTLVHDVVHELSVRDGGRCGPRPGAAGSTGKGFYTILAGVVVVVVMVLLLQWQCKWVADACGDTKQNLTKSSQDDIELQYVDKRKIQA